MAKETKFAAPGKIATLATLLDPRFKSLGFCRASYDKDYAWELLQKALADEEQKAEIKEPAQKKSKHANTFSLLDYVSTPQSTEESDFKREMDSYRAEPSDPTADSLVWWSQNSYRFSRLARLAKKYLAIPA